MKKRTIALLMAVVMLFGATVGTTIAWLTSLSATVTNTMTVGDVKITLDEADVNREVANSDGSKTIIYDEYVNSNNSHVDSIGDAARVTANEYKLYPGKTYSKDPTVHVDKTSEDCWVFIKVVNEIANIEDAGSTIASQIAANDWIQLKDKDGNDVANVYYYKEKVNADDEKGTDLPVFENFKIKTDADGDLLATYQNKTVKIRAYAVQAEGFDSATAAWTDAATTAWGF